MNWNTALWKSTLHALDALQYQDMLMANPHDTRIQEKLREKKGQAKKYIIRYKLPLEGDLKKIFNNDEQQEILLKIAGGQSDSYQLNF